MTEHDRPVRPLPMELGTVALQARPRGSRIAVQRGRRRGPNRIGFLLLPGFAMVAYACAMEPYRAANDLAEDYLYTWRHISPDGRPVTASSGVAILPDQGTDRPSDVDRLLVCAGGIPTAFDDPGTFAWLRSEAARGVRLGGVSAGAEVLARAGLLGGYRCTTHWEYLPAMRERYPKLMITRSLYELDRERCTCAGGTAALDMALALIEAECGRPLAHAIAEWFLHTRPRAADEPQRMSLRERYEVGHSGLLRVLARMEEQLEEPVSRAALAQFSGVSLRSLERLFRAHLGRSIGSHYTALRLEHARRLLRQTSLSVTETALACGFATAEHFSRTYRTRFGVAPRIDRRVAIHHERSHEAAARRQAAQDNTLGKAAARGPIV
jgi:transcriptional regulator GlxA family with amidase domain